MENNLLNGFNDGLHMSSGVGGETFDYSIDLSQRKIIEAIEHELSLEDEFYKPQSMFHSVSRRILNMKLKAKIKWSGEEVKVKPVYFAWHVGLQYKTLTGYSAASIFCNKESEYVFPLQTKFVLFFVKIWYWMRYWLWMQIRYWQPHRIKRIIYKKEIVDELPF